MSQCIYVTTNTKVYINYNSMFQYICHAVVLEFLQPNWVHRYKLEYSRRALLYVVQIARDLDEILLCWLSSNATQIFGRAMRRLLYYRKHNTENHFTSYRIAIINYTNISRDVKFTGPKIKFTGPKIHTRHYSSSSFFCSCGGRACCCCGCVNNESSIACKSPPA